MYNMQNVDDDIQDIFEYYNEIQDSLEKEMYDNGVSWSDFI